MADHRGTGSVERLIRTLRELSGNFRLALGPTFNFKSNLSAILRDLRISTHRITGRTPFSLFFGRSPNNPFSNLHVHSHSVVSDNRPILTKGTAYDMSKPELSCLYEGSDEDYTPPPSPPKLRNVARSAVPTPAPAPSAVTPPPRVPPPTRAVKLSTPLRDLVFVNLSATKAHELDLARRARLSRAKRKQFMAHQARLQSQRPSSPPSPMSAAPPSAPVPIQLSFG